MKDTAEETPAEDGRNRTNTTQNRLRKEDFHRFKSALTDLQKASKSGPDAVAAAKEAVLRLLSGEPDLAAGFEGFLGNLCVVWGKDVAYEGYLGGDGRGQGWRPGGSE